MKKSILSSLVLIASFGANAHTGAYVGAHVISSDYDITTVKTDSIQTSNGYSLTAGYGWEDSVSKFVIPRLEIQYRNYGDLNFNIIENGGFYAVDSQITSYGININPRVYFNHSFYGSFKVGYHKFESDGRANGRSFEAKSDNELIYGGGLGYSFERVSIDAMYDAFSLNGIDATNLSLGVTYIF